MKTPNETSFLWFLQNFRFSFWFVSLISLISPFSAISKLFKIIKPPPEFLFPICLFIHSNQTFLCKSDRRILGGSQIVSAQAIISTSNWIELNSGVWSGPKSQKLPITHQTLSKEPRGEQKSTGENWKVSGRGEVGGLRGGWEKSCETNNLFLS